MLSPADASDVCTRFESEKSRSSFVRFFPASSGFVALRRLTSSHAATSAGVVRTSSGVRSNRSARGEAWSSDVCST